MSCNRASIIPGRPYHCEYQQRPHTSVFGRRSHEPGWIWHAVPEDTHTHKKPNYMSQWPTETVNRYKYALPVRKNIIHQHKTHTDAVREYNAPNNSHGWRTHHEKMTQAETCSCALTCTEAADMRVGWSVHQPHRAIPPDQVETR